MMIRVGRTVVIVDDQAEFRVMARMLLEAEGFIVVGEAADVRGALHACGELRPDVVLLDVRLPDGNGFDAARTMQSWPERPAIVLTSTADYSHAVKACGARGFIPKADLSGAALRSIIGAA